MFTMAVAGATFPSLLGCGIQTLNVKVKTMALSENHGKRTVKASAGRGLGFGGAGKKVEERWQCAQGCGACCKLDKGPAFPTPEEIFHDDALHLQLYKSFTGPDGWCIHYDHGSRTCSIYEDRPFFCRVEPDVFEKLFGIEERRFNKLACSSCRDNITAVYGSGSQELKKFNRTVRNSN